MLTTKSYISSLAAALFLFAILLTGCAKDELIPPYQEETTVRGVTDADGPIITKGDDSGDADGDITDDEDDEDDSDRASNR